jgi:hypothetical protein
MLQVISDKPVAQIVTMTSARAGLLLEKCNHHNRPCESTRVDMYMMEMLAGRWMFTGEAIKISRDGQLLDGQHRLRAVANSGVAIPMLIITGLDPRAQEVMDQGKPRTLSDALKLRGEHDENNLAAALRSVAHYKRDGVPFQTGGNPGMSHGFALKLFDTGGNRTDLIDSLRFVSRAQEVRGSKWHSTSAVAALHFLFRAANADRADGFMRTLLTGENVHNRAARAVDEKLHVEYLDASVTNPRAHVKVRTTWVVQAWNAPDGTVPEFGWTYADGFPAIRGLDDELQVAA